MQPNINQIVDILDNYYDKKKPDFYELLEVLEDNLGFVPKNDPEFDYNGLKYWTLVSPKYCGDLCLLSFICHSPEQAYEKKERFVGCW